MNNLCPTFLHSLAKKFPLGPFSNILPLILTGAFKTRCLNFKFWQHDPWLWDPFSPPPFHYQASSGEAKHQQEWGEQEECGLKVQGITPLLLSASAPESPSKASKILSEASSEEDSMTGVWEPLGGRQCKRSRDSLEGKEPMADFLWSWSQDKGQEREAGLHTVLGRGDAVLLSLENMVKPHTQSFLFYILFLLDLFLFLPWIVKHNFSIHVFVGCYWFNYCKHTSFLF